MQPPTAIEKGQRPGNLLARELMERSGFLLARLGIAFKAKAIARLEQAGFELYDYTLLAILAEGARQTQAAIADTLAVDPSRLVALLDSLEERKLLVRERDPQDRRRHVVSITAEGKRELGRLRGMVKQLEDDYLSALDPAAQKTFHDLLLRLAVANDPSCSDVSTDALD